MRESARRAPRSSTHRSRVKKTARMSELAPAVGFDVPAIRLRIALVRHGESMNNVHEAAGADVYKAHRVSDPALSPRGMEQAAALGALITDKTRSALLGIHPIHELRVSPHRRTLQTMRPTATGLSMQPRVCTSLFEAGGIFESDPTYTSFVAKGGMPRTEMHKEFPTYVLPEDVDESGWYKGAPLGRETDDECRLRVATVASSLRAEAKALTESRQVVLVAHYDFLCGLLDALLLPAGAQGHPASGRFLNWRHYNTGITVIDILPTGAAVPLMVNAVPHLANRADLVSGFPM